MTFFYLTIYILRIMTVSTLLSSQLSVDLTSAPSDRLYGRSSSQWCIRRGRAPWFQCVGSHPAGQKREIDASTLL
jgi:hypothetical protein